MGTDINLWQVVEALVGQDLTKRHKNAVQSYRDGVYLPKGTLNVEASPESYLPPEKTVTVIPAEKWPDASLGKTSLLGAITIPSDLHSNYGRYSVPEVLAHENMHRIDSGGKKLDSLAKRSSAKAMDMYPPPVGVTAQEGADEFMAQMAAMEAMLPAGMKAKQTNFFKSLNASIEEIAAYLNRRYPKPSGIDGVTGLPE